MPVFLLNQKEICFPRPELAEEDGLLAVGGDLCQERLLLAYENGIFPWYDEGQEILWWCPKERFIIRPEEIHISRSMKKFMKKHQIEVRFNENFPDIIHRCRAKREFHEGTWITDAMEAAYCNLAEAGYAMCAEAFIDGQSAGGLYGVCLGRCFFGESMFSDMENGSKLALIALARALAREQFLMIDWQFHTDHLEHMGGVSISWKEYRSLLDQMYQPAR